MSPERTHAEEDIGRHEVGAWWHQAIFDNALDAIVLADDAGRYVDANPAACLLTGYGREELLERKVLDLTCALKREEGQRVWGEFLAAGKQIRECTLTRKDGDKRRVEVRAVANIAPGLHLAILRDVTESKRTEEALRKSQAEMRTLIENLPFDFWACDARGTCTMQNATAIAHWGNVIGKPLEDLEVPPETLATRRENSGSCARTAGGAIKVESDPGKGTTFQVLLPSMDATTPPIASAPTEAPAWRGEGTILVVDDEEFLRDLAKAALEKSGFTVLTASDGQEGVDVLRTHLNEVRAVILDLSMPGMGGEQAFDQLRQLRPDLPVILASGYAEEDVIARFKANGLAGVLQKPYRLQRLMETLRMVLQESSVPPSPAGSWVDP